MSPLRWLSVCCFVVCGWCAGDSFHQQAQAHLEALRKTLELLETLHQEISFRRSDLNLLCRKLIQDGQLPPETVSLQTLEPFPSLTLEERTRFSECFSGLGRLEAEQECRRLELYQAQFQAALQEGEAAARTQSMLSHKLGLAAGLTVREPDPAGVAQAVGRVLAEPGFADAARRVAASGASVVDPVTVMERALSSSAT